MLSGLDGLEEYVPLLAQEWGVPTGLVPLAALSVPLTGAVGAALGGAASRLRPSALTVVLGVAVLALGAAGFVRHPVGLGSEVAAFALFAAWALGEVMLVTALALVATAALPRLLRVRAAD